MSNKQKKWKRKENKNWMWFFLWVVIYWRCLLQCSMPFKWFIHRKISFKFNFIIRNTARNHFLTHNQFSFDTHFFPFFLCVHLQGEKIIENLFQCSDWALQHGSLVMQTQFGKNSKTVSLYIDPMLEIYVCVNQHKGNSMLQYTWLTFGVVRINYFTTEMFRVFAIFAQRLLTSTFSCRFVFESVFLHSKSRKPHRARHQNPLVK